MKLLIVSQHFWPENFRINDVAVALAAAGCSVEILTGQPNYPEGRIYPGYDAARLGSEWWAGLRLYRIPITPRGPGGAVRIALNYLSFIASGLTFAPFVLRRQKIDVVFVFGTSPILQAIPAILIACLKRAALVLWVQDLWPESLEVTGFVRKRCILNAVAAVVRWIYQRCDLILVQSHAFVPAVTAMAGAVPVEVHPNPGEAHAVHELDTAPPRLADGFNVVFAGNLGTVQALETILEAASLLSEDRSIRFVFVGSGARSAWLAAEIGARDLTNCMMLGRFPPSAMPAILDQAELLLVTLVRNHAMASTVPSKIQAYLAAGKPIIAALDGEGARVIIAAGAGRVSAAEDAVGLAASVRFLRALDVGERARIGMAGRRYYQQHFSPEVLTPRLISAFDKAIDNRRRRIAATRKRWLGY